jgi:hypothetical protein
LVPFLTVLKKSFLSNIFKGGCRHAIFCIAPRSSHLPASDEPPFDPVHPIRAGQSPSQEMPILPFDPRFLLNRSMKFLHIGNVDSPRRSLRAGGVIFVKSQKSTFLKFFFKNLAKSEIFFQKLI